MTYTWCHIVSCPVKKQAVIIDPVLDYDSASGEISDCFLNKLLSYLDQESLQLEYVLETHAHADHLTAANRIKKYFPNSKTAIGKGIIQVQEVFKKIFNLDHEFKANGSQFDYLLDEDCHLKLGDLSIEILHTPGHTEDSISYIIGENVFIGDTLFAPEYGTARCDFPGGNSEKLYQSIQRIFKLGKDKKLYLCHDYPKEGQDPVAYYLSSEQQMKNIHINNSISKQEFMKLRNQRDSNLRQPNLILPSIQVNIAAGKLPPKETNAVSYLKIPLTIKAK